GLSNGLVRIAVAHEHRSLRTDDVHPPSNLVWDEPLQQHVSLLQALLTTRAVIDFYSLVEHFNAVPHSFCARLQYPNVLGARANVRLTDERIVGRLGKPNGFILAGEAPRIRHPVSPTPAMSVSVLGHVDL